MSKKSVIQFAINLASRQTYEIFQDYMDGKTSHSEAERFLVSVHSVLAGKINEYLEKDGVSDVELESDGERSLDHELMKLLRLKRTGHGMVFDEKLRGDRDWLKNHIDKLYETVDSSDGIDGVDSYLYGLNAYHLSDKGKDELRGFFRYLLQNKIGNIPYHFIIQADSFELTRDFATDLINIAGKIRGRTFSYASFTERTLLDKPAIDDCYTDCDALIVGPCISDDQYYPSDDDSSNVRSMKKEYDNRWDGVIRFYEKHPEKLFIICGTPQIVQGRIRSNTRIYYRFFKHRIVLGSMTEDEVYQRIIQQTKRKIHNYSDDFPSKLKSYIHTVYPKADLKNMDFVNDLFEWMVALTFEKTGSCDCFSESSIPFYHKAESFESIDDEFKSLVGMESIKETFRDIGRLCQNMPQKVSEQPYLHMVFRGNPGTGKTTVAKFIARLLSSMRVIRKNHVEEVMTSDLLGEYTGQTSPKVERVLEKAEGGILFIDEAYLLNPDTGSQINTFREECVGTLMKAMEKRNDPVIIFAGYPKEMDAFLKSNPGLSSRIGYNIFFEDYSNEQLVSIFRSMCDKAGYEYDSRTLDAVERKLIALKYEENFGNARAVENIFGQAVSECLKENANNRFITEEHVKISKDLKTLDELLNELNGLVGIENAKRTVKEQILSCRFSEEYGKPRPASNNMIFVGNAGTGKTTTAKLFSEMLFSVGISKSPRTKLITAKDLYVQDVAAKLNKICAEAMGGVLFIDEIYLLQRNFYLCTEVISVLLEMLEDRKDDLTIILAGYEKQMSDFLSENQGLKSRFPITVFFDAFTEDELCQIFINECRSREMTVSDDGLRRFRSIIKAEMKKDDFGNGRAVRNLFEQAFRRHAVRFYENPDIDPDVLTEEDIEAPVAINGKDSRVGFIR